MRLVLTCALFLTALALPFPAAAVEGRFGQALDARINAVQLPHDPAFNRWPLTVGLWVRLLDPNGYNIFVAYESKASAAHWELFTKEGCLTLYAPGMKPELVSSQGFLSDGRWHYLAVTLLTNRVRMAMDGKLVTDVAVTRPDLLTTRQEPLIIGRLNEGTHPARALLDDVVIRKGQADILVTPTNAAGAGADILAAFRFDGETAARCEDLARQDRKASLLQQDGAAPVAEPPQVAEPESAETKAAERVRLIRLMTATATRLKLGSLTENDLKPRPALLDHWRTLITPAEIFQWNRQLARPMGTVYDENSLILPSDKDALGTVLRRTRAVLALRLKTAPTTVPTGLTGDLDVLEAEDKASRDGNWLQREGTYFAACALRRALILSDPLLAFDHLSFLSRGTWAGTRLTGQGNGDKIGGHFTTQHFGFITKPGGGLWIVSDWKTKPTLSEPLREATVEAGAVKGARLTGSIHSLELSYDAKTFLFAHSFSTNNSWTWTPDTTWKIFRMGVDGSGLTQLTQGPFNDFDACWLPDGNIAFISERRGGYIRCFAGLHVPSYVLHRMRADGTGLHPISLFETSEWNPSVNNDGRLVYARWDYTDREDCLGSTLWIADPDGCNPRSPHGSYPYPWTTRTEPGVAAYRSGPGRKIMAEMGTRAIPGSHKLVCTVAPHHGEHYGTIGIIDLFRPDPDNGMQQMARVTPYQPFPESECRGRSNYQYGTPWPLSEDLFLCTSWEDLVVLDRFGNEELILARTEVPRAQEDPAMRLCDPIPILPRMKPPVIPEQSNAWPDAPRKGAGMARISVMDVRNTDIPLPKGVSIRWLRVVQNFLKEDPAMDQPRIGYGDENTPRVSLGVVPVEADGSVSFLAPPNKELILQLLDEDFRAVHSMRSVAFVHKGEHLTCVGCHESQHNTPRTPASAPLAFRRPPSALQAEPMGHEPIIFARHIKPILERADLPCLGSPKTVEHKDLKLVSFHFAGGFGGNITRPVHGGARTIPGFYGARASILGNEAHAAWKAGKLSGPDYRTLTLWLDCHSLRLGAFHGEKAQMEGDLVWPRLDIDPADPLGLEGQPGENTIARLFSVAAQLHPSDPDARKRWRCADPAGGLIPGPRPTALVQPIQNGGQ
jgi:hypothetical protein